VRCLSICLSVLEIGFEPNPNRTRTNPNRTELSDWSNPTEPELYAVGSIPISSMSVTLYILSKRIIVVSPSASHTIQVFYVKHYGNIPMETSLTGVKIVIFDQCLALAWASITAGPSCVVNISTVEYRLYHLCVVRLPRSTNAMHQ